jgi:hypothetical protein
VELTHFRGHPVPVDTACSAVTRARFSAAWTMAGSGFAVSTSRDDVAAETMSSQSSTPRRTSSSSSGAELASTT